MASCAHCRVREGPSERSAVTRAASQLALANAGPGMPRRIRSGRRRRAGRRSDGLSSPALSRRQRGHRPSRRLAKRRELGLVRYQGNQRLREGLAVGQRMARDGSLLELSHAAQPAGSARTQTRMRLGERARTRDSAGPVRHRIAARLAALGFAGDLSGYLHDRYDRQLLPVLVIARELGVGNAAFRRCSTRQGCSGAGPVAGQLGVSPSRRSATAPTAESAVPAQPSSGSPVTSACLIAPSKGDGPGVHSSGLARP